MPVDHRLTKDNVRYQRELYSKSLITKSFRDFLDGFALETIKDLESILDVGCGEGLLLEKVVAAKRDVLAWGVDLCRENVKICLAHNLNAILANARKLPFCNKRFDVCVMTEVIEHLNEGEPEEVIHEVHRVLKEKGKLFLMFPNDRNYKISRLLTFKFKEAFYEMGHMRQWTPKDAVKLLQDMSFSIHKSFSVPINIWGLAINHIVIAVKK